MPDLKIRESRNNSHRLGRPLTVLTLCFFCTLGAYTALQTTIEATNSMSFCISCHEMRETVYLEYKESTHSANHSGVTTTCADCHVPKSGIAKIARKIGAAKDLYHHFIGTIESKDKFESHRLKLAESVWSYMKASDSRECRACHSFDKLDLAEQDKSARKKHLRAEDSGETCIDCHKGIAHELPDQV